MRPVFVFDGAAPALKRSTHIARRREPLVGLQGSLFPLLAVLVWAAMRRRGVHLGRWLSRECVKTEGEGGH